jgi:hypothetical protein
VPGAIPADVPTVLSGTELTGTELAAGMEAARLGAGLICGAVHGAGFAIGAITATPTLVPTCETLLFGAGLRGTFGTPDEFKFAPGAGAPPLAFAGVRCPATGDGPSGADKPCPAAASAAANPSLPAAACATPPELGATGTLLETISRIAFMLAAVAGTLRRLATLHCTWMTKGKSGAQPGKQRQFNGIAALPINSKGLRHGR